MVQAIQAGGINQLELLRARNAFQNAVRKSVEIDTQETSQPVEEKQNIPMPQGVNNTMVENLKNELITINDTITEDDIKYGLAFGRSILVDCSA